MKDKVAKVRKSTKGIPRVTDKVLAMSETDRQAWLDEACKALSPEVKAEVAARLATALTEGRKAKKVNFGTIFNGRSVAELTEAQTALTEAMKLAAVEGVKEQERIIAKAQATLDALKAAREAKTDAVA